MNYKQAIKYLNGFVNYEKKVPKSHADFNLERMRHGLDALDHPENHFFPILIAGTVGKGSTGFFLEQIIQSSGIDCGYYHSPHVSDIRERIRFNGAMLSEKIWAENISLIQASLKKNPLPRKLGEFTYFEILTLLGILLFSAQGADIGIFEIGMGGRLDATNILEAPLCLLTKIDFDHQAFLGNTLAKIANEKAGIIKKARFAVSAPQAAAAARVFSRTVKKSGTALKFAKPVFFQPGLAGAFQRQNAGNAALAAQILAKEFSFKISPANIRRGLKGSTWPGRVEVLNRKGRKVILDAAHNPAGCRVLAAELKRLKVKQLVFGALRDKDSRSMLKALAGLNVPLITVTAASPRAVQSGELADEAAPFFDKITPAADIGAALDLAFRGTRPGDVLAVTGTFYILGEARKWMNR